MSQVLQMCFCESTLPTVCVISFHVTDQERTTEKILIVLAHFLAWVGKDPSSG